MNDVMKCVLVLLFVLLAGCARGPPQAGVLVSGLDVPWAIAFFDDDSFLITERDTGTVSHYRDGETRSIGTVPAKSVGEGGLLGIAVDPDFGMTKHVFVYYTYDGNESTLNRVSRFTYDLTLKDERVLIDAIPGAPNHNGGRIAFGPDGLLYITTGDATNPSLAQDVRSLAGKILRINKDGSIPADNPFPDSQVYTYGHRNAQGIAWFDGLMVASEHGPSRNDEVSIIVAGNNYGWPVAECVDHAGYAAPIRCFDEFTLAPAAAAFDDAGHLYVAGLRGAQVRRFVLRDGVIVDESVFLEDIGRIRELQYRKGFLYLSTSNRDGRGVPRPGDDRIIRVPVP